DTSSPGTKEYEGVMLSYIPFTFVVEVKDTTAPKVEVKDLTVTYGQEVAPEDFIVKCDEVTEVTYSFVNKVDTSKSGEQMVQILVQDSTGNELVTSAKLTVLGYVLEYHMEKGQGLPSAEVFVLDPAVTAEFESELNPADFVEYGSVVITVLFDGEKKEVTVYVEDHTPPKVEVADGEGWLGKEMTAEQLIATLEDESEVSISFKEEPDWTKEGQQTVVIVVRDAYDNVTEQEVTLTLVADTQAPVIETAYIKVILKDSISYKKNITVSDNCDEASDIKLEIDNSGVNLGEEGSYKITCTATDKAGNASTKEILVQVVAADESTHTQEEIDALCDQLLAKITDASMTLEEKAYAIYDWTRNNIGYMNETPKDGWLNGAYRGLVKRAGDCYTYAATAKALLERIGLEPVMVKKEKNSNTSQSNHYWMLVDLGDGYYHYDPTPRTDGVWFFMWTDAQILEYSNAHRGSHNFTRDLYPEIN
ncbi:MAG: hypothetical protein J6R94_03820, partial [Agathobacter sp.]|nr:hypothetical protein [Agathobacter sp.]